MTILRKVQIRIRTKLLLGLSLCLSAVIIVVVVTQISGLHVPGKSTIDIVWEIYWQFIEGCVAIIVVCVAAFRSFFIQHRSRNQSPPRSPWYQGVKTFWSNKASVTSSGEGYELPTVPGASLTGMRTYIEGSGREYPRGSNSAQEQEDDLWPLRDTADGQRMTVQHDISAHWENVIVPSPSDENQIS